MYTETLGLQKYIISGVRSPKSRGRAGLLQVMSLLELVAYQREGRDLHRLRELQPAFIYQAIPFDVRRSAIGQFLVEVTRKTLRESEEHRELFEFLYDTFTFLDQTGQSIANLHLHFLLQLTQYLGFLPGGDYDRDTPLFDLREGLFVADPPAHHLFLHEEESRILYNLLVSSREDCHTVPMTAAQRRVLLQHLLDYYRLHIDNFPEIHSHRILQEVLD